MINPWGGLIYIGIPKGTRLGTVTLGIENAIKAPYFKLGTTFNEPWIKQIRQSPAPWAELEVPGELSVTVPSSAIRGLDDPQQLLVQYQKVMNAFDYISGMDTSRPRPERLVVDVKLPLCELTVV